MLRTTTGLLILGLLLGGFSGCGEASDDTGKNTNPSPNGGVKVEDGDDWRAANLVAQDRGVAYLESAADEGKYSFAPDRGADPGLTALAVRAILKRSTPERREAAIETLKWVATYQKENGGIYDQQVAVYVTSAALGAFAELGDNQFKDVMRRARDYLVIAQEDEAEGKDSSSEDYGGIGYGGSGVVNMSTTQMAIEAASDAGLPKDSDFYKKALVFLQRSQNRSESNDLAKRPTVEGVEIAAGNDGGGIYRPAESKAGIEDLSGDRKGFRSYGSMTYALLKSYLLCDLEPTDPRVTAAVDWIKAHWELEFNPGMEHSGDSPEARYQGLYYYYLTLARCLATAEAEGANMPPALKAWREDLTKALLKRQKDDGSWVNQQDRWYEGSPALVTSYAVMALAAAHGE